MNDTLLYIIGIIVFAVMLGVGLFYRPKTHR